MCKRKTIKTIGVALLCGIYSYLPAQCLWYKPDTCRFPVIQNHGFAGETVSVYQRLPQQAKAQVRAEIWNLSTNSAGLAICFTSNAADIQVRYQVSGSYAMPHMPATGVSGIDLYQVDGNDWRICYGNYHFGDTIQYNYHIDAGESQSKDDFSYCLYLPLYASVDWLEIGVPEQTRFQFQPAAEERPVVVYGTSIAQGACASRPGMAWTNILHRALACPVVNLGFSGNGRLEPDVLAFIREIDARLFILDCMANLPGEPETEITSRLVDAVLYLREKSGAPILLVEHAGYSNASTDVQQRERYAHTNRASQAAYQQLKAKGITEVYYLSHEELGLAPDSWVDYVHPSDYGMVQQAHAILEKIQTNHLY